MALASALDAVALALALDSETMALALALASAVMASTTTLLVIIGPMFLTTVPECPTVIETFLKYLLHISHDQDSLSHFHNLSL